MSAENQRVRRASVEQNLPVRRLLLPLTNRTKGNNVTTALYSASSHPTANAAFDESQVTPVAKTHSFVRDVVPLPNRAETLLDLVRDLKGDAKTTFYEMGEALLELLDKKLYAAIGYKSFEAMIEDRDIIGLTQAKKFVEVRRSFDRESALRIGSEKAFALARYCARVRDEEDPRAYLERGFPLINGKRKNVDQVSLRDIQLATKLAVTRQKGEFDTTDLAKRDAELVARQVGSMLEQHGVASRVNLIFARGTWHLKMEVPFQQALSLIAKK
jgi:hypothetical protein